MLLFICVCVCVCVCVRTHAVMYITFKIIMYFFLLVCHKFLKRNMHFILKINPDVCDNSISSI